MEKSHGLAMQTAKSPAPIRNFDVGDWVYSDTAGGVERLRVKQWVLKVDKDGTVTGSAILNDLIAEETEKLVDRIQGIVGGSTITGASQARDVIPGETIDQMPPKIPTGLSVTSAPYVSNADGQTYAQVTASWIAVTQNQDSSPLEDLAHYRIAWRYTAVGIDNSWHEEFQSQGQICTWSPVTPNQPLEVKIQAEDKAGNVSGFSSVVVATSAVDATPPPVPAAPVGSGFNGLIRWTWTGWVSGGQTPADFSHTEFHVSSVNNFTPDATTLIGTAVSFPSSLLQRPDLYDTVYYCKLISVDHNGNKSAASAQGSGQASQVVGTDIEGNIIDLSHIRFRDQANIAQDGNFTIPEYTTERVTAAGSRWAAVVGEDSGSQAIRYQPGSTGGYRVNLASGIPVIGGELFMARLRCQSGANSAPNTVRVSIGVLWTLLNGGQTLQTITGSLIPGTTAIGWTTLTAAYAQAPATAVEAEFFIQANSIALTSGFIDVEWAEVRRVIGTLLIQDAAITTAKINDLAVNTAKISDLSVGKLTAGTLAADVVLGARIATALTGARTEMNSSGFYRYTSTGAIAVQIDDTGNLLTGTFKTAATGRRIEIGAAGKTGEVEFIAPDNTVGALRSFTADVPIAGIESIMIGVDAPAASNIYGAWNAIQVAEGENIWISSRDIQLTYGGNHANTTKRFIISYATNRGTASPITYWTSVTRYFVDESNGHNWYTANPSVQRMQISPTAATGFRYLDTTGSLRLWINDSHTIIYDANDNERIFVSGAWPTTSPLIQMTMNIDNILFYPSNNRNAWARLDESQVIEQSPIFGLFNSSNYGAQLKYHVNDPLGTPNAQRMEVRNSANTGYDPIWASAFTVSSERKHKTAIRDADLDSLSILKDMRIRRFVRPSTVRAADPKNEDKSLRKAVVIEREEIGVVTDEAPSEIVDGIPGEESGVNLYNWLALNTDAIQKLIDRIEALEGSSS
jgi:hypothetical protein